jgi:fumarate reductase subunit C
MNVRLYVWQRATAALMVPFVLVHVAVIFYATHRQMTAADILSRTHGSAVWASFYGVFVAAVSVHAAIGLRNILSEWSLLTDRAAGWCALCLGIALALLGFHAVIALVVM